MNSVKRYAKNTIGTLMLPVLIIVVFGIVTGGRTLTPRMFLVTARQTVLAAIIAMAIVCNLRLGMLDFSAGGVLFTSAIVGGNLMLMTGTGVAGLIVFCLIISVAMTSLTGLLNNVFKVPAIVLTIGLVFIYESIPRLIFPDGVTIPLKQGFLSAAPYSFIVLAVMFVIFYILYNKTAFGHNIRALGAGPVLAENAGINSAKVKQMSFTLSGVFIGIAAVLYLSSRGQILNISPLTSLTTIFDALLGVFLGFFLSRYCNLAIAFPVGIFTMTMLTNNLVAMGLPATSRDIMSGIFLFILLSISANQGRLAKWREDKARAKRLTENI